MRRIDRSAIFMIPVLICLIAGSVRAASHFAPVDPPPTPAEFARDARISFRVTDQNNVGLTIFNNGFLGTNLSDRSPSFEYPIGSAQEHLVRAGLWVGGIGANEDTLVSTATIDGYFGSFDPNGVSEFFPVRTEIEEWSTELQGCCWNPAARSIQDFHLAFVDKHNQAGPEHTPLDILVEMESLVFAHEPADGVVFANYRIINTNAVDPIFDIYVGIYLELASGWKDRHVDWPPSGWFEKKDIGYYADSTRMATEHHYNFDGGDCPSWAGVKLLGTEPIDIDSLEVNFNWWNWDPGFNLADTPKDDVERYITMADTLADRTEGIEAPNNDPVSVLSVGPFPVIEAGDTITVSFAFVGGKPSLDEGRTAEEDLLYNADWAQWAYDREYNIPIPPPAPKLRVVPGLGKLTLQWAKDPEEVIDPASGLQDFEGYRIYISEKAEDEGFRLLRQVDVVDGLLEDTGLESLRNPVTIDGIDYEYQYDLINLKDGFKYWTAVTSFDTGTDEVPPLDSGRTPNRTFTIPGGPTTASGKAKVFPNPYRGDTPWDGLLPRDRYLWFVNLPQRCTIKIFSLAGDLVDTIEFDGATYNATEIRGIFDPTDIRNPERDIPTLSGGMAAWDLVSRNDQGVASGLYIFSIEDHESGDTQLGKFLILK